jgi:polysaccharide export outer membrane protein
MFRNVFLPGALLLVTGCAGAAPIAMAPSIEQAPLNELPPPDGADPAGNYLADLGPLDTVSIEVDGLPDLRREQVVIDADGMLSYPLAGSVKAAGLSTTELARALEDRLRVAHMRSPKVSVNLVQLASKVVTVSGAVNKPGLYPVDRQMTLLQAVASASGTSQDARSSVVTVLRESGGKQYVGLYNLKAIGLGNYPDPAIYPDDKVVVGESGTRKILQLVGPLVSLITTPLIYIINRSRN